MILEAIHVECSKVNEINVSDREHHWSDSSNNCRSKTRQSNPSVSQQDPNNDNYWVLRVLCKPATLWELL